MSDPVTSLLLSWNTYSSVYSSSFSSLRKHPKYGDITLVVDDGHALAHKILLTTCSPLLASIMELSPNPGVVYLNNISFKNLNLILDFMYTGEANVENEDINEFLAAASMLKLLGLEEHSSEREVVQADELNKKPYVSEERIESQRRSKRNMPARKNTPAKKSTSAKKRRSVEPSLTSKNKRKVLEKDVEPDDSAILVMIRNENEPAEEAVDCIEQSSVIPDEDISLNVSDIDAHGIYILDSENTIDEITLDDEVDKIITTKDKKAQAKLKATIRHMLL